MKNVIFKFQFIVGLLLFTCLNVQADDDLITKQITVKLDEAGTLSSKIGDNKKYKITNIKIVGEINSWDVSFLRDMAGYAGRANTDGKLSVIDLTDAKIVETIHYDGYYEEKNVLMKEAFAFCPSLTNITLPKTVVSIGDDAFAGCSNLANINISFGLTTIGESAFNGCSALSSITLPTTVTSIGDYAFGYCSTLSSITLPSSVTSIGYRIFDDCDRLGEINYVIEDLPSYISSYNRLVREIPSTAILKYFFEGSELSELEIPSSVTSIGYSVFYGCLSLINVSIPSSVTSIGSSAFYGCIGLTDISIPQSVTSIDECAFKGCVNLKNIYVNWDIPTNFGKDCFEGIDINTCTLYIPKGTYDDYWLSSWGDFKNIVEYDATGIDNVTTSSDAKEISRYSVDGQRLEVPTKGLNIVKYSDGSVKKVVVQ